MKRLELENEAVTILRAQVRLVVNQNWCRKV
jgi:hypothetical protein